MKFKILLLITIIVIRIQGVGAQTIATEIANKQAQKMKRDLVLNDSVSQCLYNINIQIHNRKMYIRQQNIAKDSTVYYIQKIENSRDSLYQKVLSENQYLLYKQKKRELLNNN